MAYEDTRTTAEEFSMVWKPMRYFHLRPTGSKSAVHATIVCTIPQPYAAFRGKRKATRSYIAKHYNDLLSITPDISNEDVLSKLKCLNFSIRESDKPETEKLIQAMFINLLYDNKDALADCGYNNVRFIASEFVYPVEGVRHKLPDVIAESDEGILLIEIKKGEDINAGDDIAQLLKYKKVYFEDNHDDTINLLMNYPNHKLTKDKPVVPIYLLREGRKQPTVAKDDVVILRFNIDGDKITVRR